MKSGGAERTTNTSNSQYTMGALTSKKGIFARRPWESRAFQEIDETDIVLFRTRVEKLKNRRSRILPIKYWISDLKRFTSEPSYNNTSTSTFLICFPFDIKSKIFIEKLKTHYVYSPLKTAFRLVKRLKGKNMPSILLGNNISQKTFKLIPPNAKIYQAIPTSCQPEAITRTIQKSPLTFADFNLDVEKLILLTNP